MGLTPQDVTDILNQVTIKAPKVKGLKLIQGRWCKRDGAILIHNEGTIWDAYYKFTYAVDNV